jgi:hypothetical protein
MSIVLDGTAGITTPDLTDTSLTTGRVVYTTTSGNLTSSANLLFAGSDLTVNSLTVGRGAGGLDSNAAFGNLALATNSTGVFNTAVGSYEGDNGRAALRYNTTGNYNAAFGNGALGANTTGSGNSAFGFQSSWSNTTGASNVSVGLQSLRSNTTASNNTAVGYQAGYANTTGAGGTAIGNLALRDLTTGNYNTALGYQAGRLITTGSNNLFVGTSAGYALTTASYNTFVGALSSISYGCGELITTGAKNTIIGGYNGNQNGLDIRTASNYIVLSDGDGNPRAYQQSTGGWFQHNNSASWSTTSDARIKENVETITNGLNVVMALRPVEFDYIISKQHTAGFIAQEYEAVLPDQITENVDIGDELKALTNGEPVKVIEQNLVPYLVKAIQELEARIKQLERN